MKRIYKVWMACLALACGAGWTGCADSLEDMKKENYEANWIKTFGKVDPNHTWNIAIQAEAELAIKEDALTEYTFKIYDNDPIWGTEAQLLAKTTVKTDANGFACTQLKFDAPASLEQYYITRTDSHGRRALTTASPVKGKIEASFGNTNQSAARVADLPEITTTNNLVAGENWPEDPNDYTTDSIQALIEGGYVINSNEDFKYTEYNYIDNITTIDENITNNKEEVTQKRALVINNNDFRIRISLRGYNDSEQAQLIFRPTDGISEYDFYLSESEKTIRCVDIIVAPGCTLNLHTTMEDGSERELTLDKNCRIIVMPGATLNYDGLIDLGNDGPILYNAGTMNLNRIKANHGSVYNAVNGVIHSEVFQFVNSEANSTLTNWGKIETDSVYGSNNNFNPETGTSGPSFQGTINNACFLKANSITIQTLNLGANSALECTSINIEDGTLRNNSILRSDNMYIQNSNIYYQGEAEGNALISTDRLINIHYSDGSHINDLDGTIHFEVNEYGNGAEAAMTAVHNATQNEFTRAGEVGDANIVILPNSGSSGDDISQYSCVGHGNIPTGYDGPMTDDGNDDNTGGEGGEGNGGNEGGEGNEGEDILIEWIIACEDLGSSGDYDFNDVVFSVSYANDTKTLYIKPLAAGGTLPIDLCYGNETLGEIHYLLSPGAPTNKAINASGKGNPGAIITKYNVEGFTITENMGGFKIKVNGKEEYLIGPSNGLAPQMLCIPSPWVWPKEGIGIHHAYQGFGEWGANYNNNTWYQSPQPDKVVE